jgi:hypothetical protein
MSSTDVQAVRKKSESARLCAPASLPLHLLQERLGYCFRDSAGLERALTHPSSTVDDDDNERMEFLGDAILSLCVGQMLYECYPDWSEGRLTEVKSVVVSTSCLARVAGRLQLRNFSRLGKGLPSGEPLPASGHLPGRRSAGGASLRGAGPGRRDRRGDERAGGQL